MHLLCRRIDEAACRIVLVPMREAAIVRDCKYGIVFRLAANSDLIKSIIIIQMCRKVPTSS